MGTNFFTANRVFITGLISAIALAVQQVLASGENTDSKVYGFAVLIAVMSYIANEWAGKGVTILGIIGTVAAVFVSVTADGIFTWFEFLTAALIAISTAIIKEPTVVNEVEINDVIEGESVRSTSGIPRQRKRNGISDWIARILE